MKKIAVAAAALLCAAAAGINAAAFDYSGCRSEWDPSTDCIYYRDNSTNKIVAIEYPDGRIEEYAEPEPSVPTEEEPDIPYPWEIPEETEEEWYPTEEPSYYYDDPYIQSIDAGSEKADVTALIDSRWDFDGWAVYDNDWWGDNDECVAEGTSSTAYSATENKVSISLSGLNPGDSYDYRLEFYKNDIWGRSTICSVDFSFTTLLPMYEPVMKEPYAASNSLTIMAVLDGRYEADGFVVEKYSKNKWVMVEKNGELEYYYGYDYATGIEEEYNRNYSLRKARYTFDNLSPMTKYKYRIRFFKNTEKGKRKYISTVSGSAYTLMAAPELDIGATSKNAKLSWNKVKGADGYEVYVYSEKAGQEDYSGNWGWYSGGYDSYLNYSTGWYDPGSFKKLKTIKSGKTTSASFDLKGSRTYTYCVRAYKKVKGGKVYSEFSRNVSTNSNAALLNGLKLSPKSTGLGDYDLGLVKVALKQCVNDKMSNAEKAAAVYDYVHNVAQYEYDINKVSLDSVKAILSDHAGQCYQYAVTYQAMMKYLGFDVKLIGGKTASGGPHWWNEMVINGTPYMFDPQVGGRFCILYEQLGSRMVTKEKTID